MILLVTQPWLMQTTPETAFLRKDLTKDTSTSQRKTLPTIVKNNHQRSQEVTHALDITNFQVLPDIAVERRNPCIEG